jgi:hypothetical protein
MPAKAGIFFQHLKNPIIQIIPLRIFFFNQLYLPRAAPFFHRLFPRNRIKNFLMTLKKHEAIQPVCLRKTFDFASTMLAYAPDQVRRNPDIQGAVTPVGYDINPPALFPHPFGSEFKQSEIENDLLPVSRHSRASGNPLFVQLQQRRFPLSRE